jgi:hypothetical protein
MAQIKLNATYGLTGTLPAVSGANLTSLTSGNLTGALPAISGASLTGISGGKVLQVIHQEKNSDSHTTSTSFATYFTSPITPSATSSKILVMLSLQYNLYGNGSTSFPNGVVQILDNGDTSLCKAFGNASGNISTDQTDQWDSSLSLQILHSPSSTSELTYKVSARAGSGRFGIMGSGNREVGSTLTLIEIGA